MPTLEPLSSVSVLSASDKKKNTDSKKKTISRDDSGLDVPPADRLMIKQLFTKQPSSSAAPRELDRNIKNSANRMKQESNRGLYNKMKDLDDVDATLARIRQTTKELESRIGARSGSAAKKKTPAKKSSSSRSSSKRPARRRR